MLLGVQNRATSLKPAIVYHSYVSMVTKPLHRTYTTQTRHTLKRVHFIKLDLHMCCATSRVTKKFVPNCEYCEVVVCRFTSQVIHYFSSCIQFSSGVGRVARVNNIHICVPLYLQLLEYLNKLLPTWGIFITQHVVHVECRPNVQPYLGSVVTLRTQNSLIFKEKQYLWLKCVQIQTVLTYCYVVLLVGLRFVCPENG